MRFLHWLKEEIIKVLPAIIFFMVSFNIIHFSDVLMLRAENLRYTSYMGATLGAIIAGKVVLIANSLPFINAFPKKPLIYNIFWKFFIFGVCALLAQFLDFLVKQTYHVGLNEALLHLGEMITKPMFWSVQIWVLFLFFIFVVFSEYMRVIGKDKVVKILIG